MNKLSKEYMKQRNELADALDEAKTALEEAVMRARVAAEVAWVKVTEAQATYNEVAAQARDFVETVASDLRNYYDEKSEKWQEGERGQAYDSWAQEWENFDLQDAELDEPEIAEPDLGGREILDELPDEGS